MSDVELERLRRAMEARPEDEQRARRYELGLLRVGEGGALRARYRERYGCGQRWEELAPNGLSVGDRDCGVCGGRVGWVDSAGHAQDYAARGHCVAGVSARLEEVVDRAIEALRAGRELPVHPRCVVVGEEGPERPEWPGCGCDQTENRMHDDVQDTSCEAWSKVREAIAQAKQDRVERLVLLEELSREERRAICTLPREIGELTELRELVLYGSFLSVIPPEIGRLRALERFVPYTSYRLHWFPFEITRCGALTDSTISTRALYGNYKNAMAAPNVKRQRGPQTETCSVCDRPVTKTIQRWTHRWVATDRIPLLVNACSRACLEAVGFTTPGGTGALVMSRR